LGECSTHGFGTFNRNNSSDATYDEFYVWTSGAQSNLNNAFQMWQRGRYYKPLWANAADAAFVSGPINLAVAGESRALAPPSNVSVTTASGSGAPPKTSSSSLLAGSSGALRLLGVSWTWFAEDYVKTGTPSQGMVPVVFDHKDPAAPATLYQTDTGAKTGKPVPCVRLFVMADGQQYPLLDSAGFQNDGYSPIVESKGKPLQIVNPSDIKYKVWFQLKGVGLSSILLSTPYFDDVTLYFDTGDVEYLQFTVVNA